MDDIIIFGSSEDEFLANLDSVLSRLVFKGITCNPDKCKLGLKEIEYVGHLLDSEGFTFSREKLKKVIQVPRPETKKDMIFPGFDKLF